MRIVPSQPCRTAYCFCLLMAVYTARNCYYDWFSRICRVRFLRTVLQEEQLHLFTPHQLGSRDFILCILSAHTCKNQTFISGCPLNPSIGLQATSQNLFGKYVPRITVFCVVPAVGLGKAVLSWEFRTGWGGKGGSPQLPRSWKFHVVLRSLRNIKRRSATWAWHPLRCAWHRPQQAHPEEQVQWRTRSVMR